MNLKKSVARFMLLGIVAGCLCVSTTPASASTYSGFTVHYTCSQANFLLGLLQQADEQLEAAVAANPNNAFLQQYAAQFDQYISDAVNFIEAHTTSGCVLSDGEDD